MHFNLFLTVAITWIQKIWNILDCIYGACILLEIDGEQPLNVKNYDRILIFG